MGELETPSPPYCGLDLAPSLADLFVFGVAPIDCSPILLLMPFGFRIAPDTLPSGIFRAAGLRSALAVSGSRRPARQRGQPRARARRRRRRARQPRSHCRGRYGRRGRTAAPSRRRGGERAAGGSGTAGPRRARRRRGRRLQAARGGSSPSRRCPVAEASPGRLRRRLLSGPRRLLRRRRDGPRAGRDGRRGRRPSRGRGPCASGLHAGKGALIRSEGSAGAQALARCLGDVLARM